METVLNKTADLIPYIMSQINSITLLKYCDISKTLIIQLTYYLTIEHLNKDAISFMIKSSYLI